MKEKYMYVDLICINSDIPEGSEILSQYRFNKVDIIFLEMEFYYNNPHYKPDSVNCLKILKTLFLLTIFLDT